MDSYFDAESLLGETIGDWHLKALLGEGGMSFIFRGVHTSSGMEGAVKLLRPEFCQNQQTVLRFEQEARLAGQLQHENIVRVLDFGQDKQRRWYFMVLELLHGLDLGSVMPKAPFPKRWIAALTQQICSALEAAHSEGIIHRDLKPSNIFLLPRKPFPLVKLLDFGVAKLIYQQTEKQLTQAGEIIGTPAYVAPEQFSPKNPLTHRADIYALGVLLFQLFTGKLPIDGGSAIAHAVMVLQQEAPLISELRSEFADTQLEVFVKRLLSKQADERPASMQETWELFCEVAQVLSDPLDTAANIPDLDALVQERWPEDSEPAGEIVVPTDEEDPGEATFVMPEGAEVEVGETTFVVTSALSAEGDGGLSSAQRQRLEDALGGVSLGDTAVDHSRHDGGVALAQPKTEFDLAPVFASEVKMKKEPAETEVELDASELGEMTMMDAPIPVVVGQAIVQAQEEQKKRENQQTKADVGAMLDEVLANDATRDSSDIVEQVRKQASKLPLAGEQDKSWFGSDSESSQQPSTAASPLSLAPRETPAVTEKSEAPLMGASTLQESNELQGPKRFTVAPVAKGLVIVLFFAGLVLVVAWLLANYAM